MKISYKKALPKGEQGWGMLGTVLSMGIVVIMFGVLATVYTKRVEDTPKTEAPADWQSAQMARALGDLQEVQAQLMPAGVEVEAVIEEAGVSPVELLQEIQGGALDNGR